MKPNIAALIITYNPDCRTLISNIKAISSQVTSVLIVDNGSKNYDEIKVICSEINTSLIELYDNYGIAKALNVGIENLKEKGVDWVITLDQDSLCPTNLIDVLQKYCGRKDLAIICPAIDYSGEGVNKLITSSIISYPYACMTSASLTRVAAWESVGGFSEEYFIDHVDNDFCKKLELCGYKILRDNSVFLKHHLGERKTINIFGKKILYGEHSPLRSYYIARNNLYFIIKYRKSLNCTKEVCKWLYVVWHIILYSSNRIQHARSIYHGIKDCMSNKMGKKK